MQLLILFGVDNGRHAFGGRSVFRRCPACNGLTDKWAEDAIQIPKVASISADVSATYDGIKIVSSRFRSAYAEAGLHGLAFFDVGNGFAALRPTRRVRFDAVSRGTRFESLCQTCGRYESVAGGTPVFLLPPVDVQPNEFVWTDVEFGSGDEKSPILICGSVAADALRRAKLKGLDIMKDVRCVAQPG